MADTKTTALSPFTPVLTDLLYGVDDPGGTPVSGKLTLTSVRDLFIGGTDTQVQFNDAGAFGGDSGFIYDGSGNVTITGQINIGDSGVNFSSESVQALYYVDIVNEVNIKSPGNVSIRPNNATNSVKWEFETSSLNLAISSTSLKLRAASNVVAVQNGTNAQTLEVHNTFTDASNYERGGFKWNTNILEVFSEAAGTGTARPMSLTPADIRMPNLPTSDPTVAGQLWNNSGVLTVSAG